MRVAFSAGEASGDAYAAAINTTLRRELVGTPWHISDSRWSEVMGRFLRDLPDDASIRQAIEDFDSLDLVETIMMLEDEFDVELIEDEVRGLTTFAELKSYIRSKPRKLTVLENLICEGIGGARSREAGIQLVADSSKWGAIGIAESFKVGFRVLLGYLQMRSHLGKGAPGVFVPIDFGFVNIRLARHAKRFGWKVLYFIPPGSWRRDRQGVDLPAVTDKIVTPFPWSAEILNSMGGSAHFFGHPLKEMALRDLVERGDTIAVLPGSRQAELERHLPILAASLPDDRIAEFAVAPSIQVADLSGKWRELAPNRNDIFTQGDTYGVFQRAQAAIVCSGTATLEAALCKCPMVVIYRVSRLVELQGRLMGLTGRHISLPNILMGREVVPELVQNEATPENVRNRLESLLLDSLERQAQLEAFAELEELLGPPTAITRTAELLAEMAGFKP